MENLSNKDKPISTKGFLKGFLSTVMMFSQVFGWFGLLFYAFLFIGLDGNVFYFIVQFVCTILSLWSWKFFKGGRFLIAIILTLLPVISMLVIFYIIINSTSYN